MKNREKVFRENLESCLCHVLLLLRTHKIKKRHVLIRVLSNVVYDLHREQQPLSGHKYSLYVLVHIDWSFKCSGFNRICRCLTWHLAINVLRMCDNWHWFSSVVLDKIILIWSLYIIVPVRKKIFLLQWSLNFTISDFMFFANLHALCMLPTKMSVTVMLKFNIFRVSATLHFPWIYT